jgi:ElaB/YqjD/DUF883 family membrane-anchored ribosome-binding protein
MAHQPSATSKSEANPETRLHQVEAELAALRADISALAHSLKDYGGAKKVEFEHDAEELSEDLRATARKTLKDVRAKIDSLEQDVDAGVAGHPVQAMLLAFGVGVVISTLLRRH